MKTMTCKQLDGACDMKFQAETFQELATLSQQHGSQMTADPEAMQTWMKDKEAEFNALPEDNN